MRRSQVSVVLTGICLSLAVLPVLSNPVAMATPPDTCAAMLCLAGQWQSEPRCVGAIARVATARARGETPAACDLTADPSALVTLKWLAERHAVADRRVEPQAAPRVLPRSIPAAPASPVATTAADGSAALDPKYAWEVLATDATVAQTLVRWTRLAGMRLQWDAPRTFVVTGPTVLHGDFETALAALLASPGIRHSEQPLEACIYANTPPLVRITRLGEQSRLCDAP